MPVILDHSRFNRKPSIIATDLENELVLLDPETRQMYRLNVTGRAVWQGLAERDVDGLVRMLVELFEVTPARALQDLRSVLSNLLDAGLILPVNAID